MNGHRRVGGDQLEPTGDEAERLRGVLATIRAETLRLRELAQELESERRAALRDAVIRTRETIQQFERHHEAALRHIDQETERELTRLRAGTDETPGQR